MKLKQTENKVKMSTLEGQVFCCLPVADTFHFTEPRGGKATLHGSDVFPL